MQTLTNMLLAALAFSHASRSVRAYDVWPNARETLRSRTPTLGRNSTLHRRLSVTPVHGAVAVRPVGLHVHLPRDDHNATDKDDKILTHESKSESECDHSEEQSSSKTKEPEFEDQTQFFPSRYSYGAGLGGIIATSIGVVLAGFHVRECCEKWSAGNDEITVDACQTAFIFILLILGVGFLLSSILRKDHVKNLGNGGFGMVLGFLLFGGAAGGALIAGGFHHIANNATRDILPAVGMFVAGGLLLFAFLLFFAYQTRDWARGKLAHRINLLPAIRNVSGSLCLLGGLGFMTHSMVTTEDISNVNMDGLGPLASNFIFVLLAVGFVWFSHVFISKFDNGNKKWAGASAGTFCGVASMMVLGANGAAMGDFEIMAGGFSAAGAIFIVMIILKMIHIFAPNALKKLRDGTAVFINKCTLK